MTNGIMMILNEHYDSDSNADCIDLIQMKNICQLYKNKSNLSSISLSDIQFSSPEFKKPKTNKKGNTDVLKTPEFQKKYLFFIKVIFCCLKVGVEIFEISQPIQSTIKESSSNSVSPKSGSKTNKKRTKEPFLTMKNNYQLVKAILSKKKELITEHIEVLKLQQKNISTYIDKSYEAYMQEFLFKIQILDKVARYIDTIVKNDVLDKTDNLFALVLPYFYVYQEYIEEYVA